MSETAVHIENLSFGYTRQELVLNGLNLNVPQGAIYGFLGVNGAGKTTTLKMILRLIRNYNGDISIYGKDIKSQYPDYLKQIGSLIEAPSIYGHLSAGDNLKIWANYYNADQKRIPEVLDIVELSNTSYKKAENFSTGMKQRLGLATALLHDPQLLILDEPTNGLDPMGIMALRKVLFRLNDSGKTILLSSHILSEVEKIASHIGILKGGALVFEGTIDELHAHRLKNIEVTIQVNDANKALQSIELEHKKLVNSNTILMRLSHRSQIPIIINELVKNEIEIYEVKQLSSNLESMFLSISKEDQP